MSLSFQAKLILAISLLAAGISSVSSYIFYQTIQSHVWTQTAARLKDIGRAGQYMLNLEDRRGIQELDRLSEQMARPRNPNILESIRPGENLPNLSDGDRQKLESRKDYRRLVQIMRRIKHSTRQSLATPDEEIPQQIDIADPPLLRYAYILVPIPESPDRRILKFIVDGDDRRLDTDGDGAIESDEEATQIGMLYNVTGQPQMLKALDGQVTASKEYYRDEWGVWLSAYIPIQDSEGQTFAVMGIDLSAESEFSLINRVQRILAAVVVTSVFLATILGLVISRILARPLTELTAAVTRVQNRDFNVRLKTNSRDEFGRLAQAFNEMVRDIESYALYMEDIVTRKSQELQTTLRKVRDLKNQQDADYYLTTMLANPLLKNGNVSNVVHTDFLIEYKKKFQYEKWEAELGGDLCVTANPKIEGEGYTFFFNGDAAGHAMKGAGGALITGSLLSSLVAREGVGLDPSEWLQGMVLELQKVFRGLDGRVKLSCVMGLIHDRSGALYSINAGHPKTVLFRNGRARFLEESPVSSRIGEEMGTWPTTRVQLETGDVLVAGSDGRDSMRVGGSPIKQSGPDNDTFLGVVEKGQAELHRMREILYSLGEPADDISLMRIAYRESVHPPGATPGSEAVVEEVEKLIRLEEYNTALSLLSRIEDENFFRHYYSGLCYSRIGDNARALESLQEARNLVGERANVLYLLGQTYANSGRRFAAIEVLQKAAFLQPEDDRISTLLESLQSEPAE